MHEHETSQADEGDVVWSQVAPLLDRSMDALAERDRSALLLRFFEHHTLGEIGAALQITEDAARMRIDRALSRLREQLARRGIKSTSGALGLVMTHHAVSAAPAFTASAAADAALTTTVSPWARFADFVRSFRTGEVAVLAAAWLTIAGALVVSTRVRPITHSIETHRAADAPVMQPLAYSLPDFPPAVPAIDSSRIVDSRDPRPSQETRLAGGRRANLRATYDPLFRALELTPEQIVEFESVLVPTLNSALWIFDLPTALDQAPTEPSSETDRKLRTILGAENYAGFRDYQRMLPARSVVREVASAVYLSDPLDRAKGDQLTQLLVAASVAYQAGGDVQLAGLDWGALFHSARPLLSAAQWSALQAVQHRIAFQEALQQRLARSPGPSS